MLPSTAGFAVEALGDFTGVATGWGALVALGDLRGVSVAAALAARPVFFALEGAALGNFFAEVDAAATVGDARFADAGTLDTPPLTADLGVLAGDFLADAGDLAAAAAGDLAITLLDFPGEDFVATLGDFAGALPLPFPVKSWDLRAAIASHTKHFMHWQALNNPRQKSH